MDDSKQPRRAGQFGRKCWQKFPSRGHAQSARARRGLDFWLERTVPFVNPGPKVKRDRQGKKAIKAARREQRTGLSTSTFDESVFYARAS